MVARKEGKQMGSGVARGPAMDRRMASSINRKQSEMSMATMRRVTYQGPFHNTIRTTTAEKCLGNEFHDFALVLFGTRS